MSKDSVSSTPGAQPASRFDLNANLGLGFSVNNHVSGEGAIDVFGADAGLGLSYSPNGGKTVYNANAGGIFGFGYKTQLSLGIEHKINDNLTLGVNGYTETMQSATSARLKDSQTYAKTIDVTAHNEFGDVNTVSERFSVSAEASDKYRLAQTVSGANVSLSSKLTDQLTLTAGAGIRYTSSNNNDIHVSKDSYENYELTASLDPKLVRKEYEYNGEPVYIMESVPGVTEHKEGMIQAHAEVNKNLKGSSLSPILSAGLEFNPTKKTYLKASVQIDPTNLSNNSAAGVTFGLKF